MSKQVIVDQISLSELKELIEVTVAEELRKFVTQTNESTDPTCRQKAEMLGIESTILTRYQTAKILGVSLPTLHTWTKNGVIQGTRIGSRVRYRMSDVEAALKDIEHIKYRRGNYY